MSIKTILVYLPSEKNAAAVLQSALKFAQAESTHVVGLHIAPSLPLYGEFPVEISEEVTTRLKNVAKQATAGAKQIFDAQLQNSSISHEWRCFTAAAAAGADLIARHGRTADLIVCAKPGAESPDPWGDFSETAIMQSGRPVLIVPGVEPPKTIGENVIIAWNDTREAARAVFDSLPLLQRAAKVRAVTLIDKESLRTAAEALGADLIASLGRHGIKATFEASHIAGGPGDGILSRLLDEGCDLLVMGGYSRSRFREMLFGGASRDILRDTWVPVLLSH